MFKQIKIIQVLIIIIALSQIVLTQTRDIVIHKKDGVNRTSVANVDSITFQETGTVTDVDGNVYKTVKIGNQWWMAENLRVTHYNDHTSSNPQQIADCWVYKKIDGNEVDVDPYGRLYSWHAVNTGKLAPAGWHVPTDEEWKELEMELGMSQEEANKDGVQRGTNEGSKLAGRAVLWSDGDLDNDVEFGASGFAGLPAGCSISGNYYYIGSYAYFWSASPNGSNAWYRSLDYIYTKFYRTSNSKEVGFSVRCVKNNTP